MKKHSIFKVVLITLFVIVLLTWLFPVGTISTSFSEQERAQIGLFDLLNNVLGSLSYFGNIIIYILLIGGFYGILSKIPAYRAVLDKMVVSFKGKEKVVLSVIVVLLAVLTSVGGLQLGLVVFFPMLIALILLMGFDKITAALALVGSTMVGMAGTTFGYSNIAAAMSLFNIQDIHYELLSRVVILVVGVFLLLFNILMYNKVSEKKATKKPAKKAAAKATKAVTAKVEELEGFIPAKVSARKKVTVWPVVTVLSLVFILIVLSLVSWSGAFGITVFEKATEAVTKFQIFKFPLFAKILGTFNPFGSWTINDLNIVLVIASLVLGFIYKIGTDDFIDAFVSGVKKALAPAFIIFLIYVCFACTLSFANPFASSFTVFIYHGILDITKEFNILTGSLVAILASVFNVELPYALQSVGIVLTTTIKDTSSYPIAAVVIQSIYGLTMLVAPTSVILMGTLTYLDIPYTKWLKAIWKLVLELLAVLLIIFIIMVAL